MRKLLVALMIMAFAVTAFADVKLSGYYNVTGQYQQNVAAYDDDTDDVNSFYEQEFKMWIKADTDKDTYFKAKLEIADNTWGVEKATGTGSEYSESTHLQVERAWMGHNFGVLKLDVGLMDGGAWGYSFGNNKEGYYRVKATIPAGPGNVFLIAQKNKEMTGSSANDQTALAALNPTDKDAEKDDNDYYIVAYKGKFGGMTVAPLFGYIMDSSASDDNDTDGNTTSIFDLAVGGAFGAVGFESEFKYYDVDSDTGADQKYWGAMANVFGKVSGATVGFITAYASSDDEDGTFNMADDFDDDYPFVLGDEGVWCGGDLKGAWANILYASFDVNEKLNVNGAFTYLTSNFESGVLEDATAYELDLGVDYMITKALAYNVDLGYAKVDLDTGTDPDPALVVKHALTLSF